MSGRNYFGGGYSSSYDRDRGSRDSGRSGRSSYDNRDYKRRDDDSRFNRFDKDRGRGGYGQSSSSNYSRGGDNPYMRRDSYNRGRGGASTSASTSAYNSSPMGKPRGLSSSSWDNPSPSVRSVQNTPVPQIPPYAASSAYSSFSVPNLSIPPPSKPIYPPYEQDAPISRNIEVFNNSFQCKNPPQANSKMPKEVEEKIGQAVMDVKMEGIFDKIRNKCINDILNTSTYTNVQDKILNRTDEYLKRVPWTKHSLQRNVRDRLKAYLVETNFFKNGVNQLVEESLSDTIKESIDPVFTKAIHEYLGFKKKEEEDNKKRDEETASKSAAEEIKNVENKFDELKATLSNPNSPYTPTHDDESKPLEIKQEEGGEQDMEIDEDNAAYSPPDEDNENEVSVKDEKEPSVVEEEDDDYPYSPIAPVYSPVAAPVYSPIPVPSAIEEYEERMEEFNVNQESSVNQYEQVEESYSTPISTECGTEIQADDETFTVIPTTLPPPFQIIKDEKVHSTSAPVTPEECTPVSVSSEKSIAEEVESFELKPTTPPAPGTEENEVVFSPGESEPIPRTPPEIEEENHQHQEYTKSPTPPPNIVEKEGYGKPPTPTPHNIDEVEAQSPFSSSSSSPSIHHNEVINSPSINENENPNSPIQINVIPSTPEALKKDEESSKATSYCESHPSSIELNVEGGVVIPSASSPTVDFPKISNMPNPELPEVIPIIIPPDWWNFGLESPEIISSPVYYFDLIPSLTEKIKFYSRFKRDGRKRKRQESESDSYSDSNQGSTKRLRKDI